MLGAVGAGVVSVGVGAGVVSVGVGAGVAGFNIELNCVVLG